MSSSNSSRSDVGADGSPNPPAEIEDRPQEVQEMESICSSDQDKFDAADSRRKEDDRALVAAQTHLLKLRADLHKAQQKVDDAQRAYCKARNMAQENAEQDADDLLLEPTPWNNYYKQLKGYYDREGHSNFKRTITDADVEGLSENEAKEIRTLSWWTCRQRKFKRRGELEQHKILLLNRLKFNWDPHAGPGPEKWLKNYGLLKEFKQRHGHVKVPVRYAENKLGSWLKTQVTQYRNAQEGKLPALSAERIRLLEEIGINWGQKRVTTPWDDRFQTLMEYKRRFGSVNVPWQWKENVALAQWVNSQRKKYKDLLEGKRNNLSEEQINRLNSIGFKWNTGGKGRYIDNPSNDEADMMTTDQVVPPLHVDAQHFPPVPPVSAAGLASPPVVLPTGLQGLPPEGLPAVTTNQFLSNNAAANLVGSIVGIHNNPPVPTVAANLVGSIGHNNPPPIPMQGSIVNMSQEQAMNNAAQMNLVNQNQLAQQNQSIVQQNQQELSMLAYAYQQLNQQINNSQQQQPNCGHPNNNGGINPFL